MDINRILFNRIIAQILSKNSDKTTNEAIFFSCRFDRHIQSMVTHIFDQLVVKPMRNMHECGEFAMMESF